MTLPLVSCICVTQNRRFFLRQAIAQWRRATQAIPIELVIVDGSPEPFTWLRNWIESAGENVLYAHVPSTPHSRVGWFHNEAIRLSRGQYIITWDDDDWQSPSRVVRQLSALEKHPEGAIAYTSRFYRYHLETKTAQRFRAWHQGGGSIGSATAFHRSVWEKIPYQDVPQGEDNYFWDDHTWAGTTMIDMKDPSLFVYIRHPKNGSPLEPTSATNPDYAAEARAIMGSDVDFYDELSELFGGEVWNAPHPPAGFATQMQALAMVQRAMRRNLVR